MKDSNGFHKGYGERDYNGRTYRVVTETLRGLDECGRELRKNIRLLAKQLKHIN